MAVKSKKTKSSVRVGLIQSRCEEDPAANLKKALSQIKTAAARGARIVCLQELFKTRYFCQTEDPKKIDLAETVPGPTTEALAKAAKSLKVVIVAPLFEKRASGLYHNTAAVIDADGKFLGKYRKMHIPDDPGFYEKFYFVPGDLGFRVFETRYAKIGVLICWDQWFPEAARLTALQGAEILFYPTAIGWKPEEQEETRHYYAAWETVQRSHAIANGVYVAAVNRVGKEGALKFWGSSFIADPFGAVLYRGGASNEEIVIADCDLSRIEKTRREWPFFRDRRIDAITPSLHGISAKEFRRCRPLSRTSDEKPAKIPDARLRHGKLGGLRPRFSFRMPAEWERHESTWLVWPTNKETWPGKLLKDRRDLRSDDPLAPAGRKSEFIGEKREKRLRHRQPSGLQKSGTEKSFSARSKDRGYLDPGLSGLSL